MLDMSDSRGAMYEYMLLNSLRECNGRENCISIVRVEIIVKVQLFRTIYEIAFMFSGTQLLGPI